ncbi:MAG: hypothetical protein P8R42_10125 [Candidatus Binatia bacterium]|nr:hypothetical protein [Candidatus Binatia bacterium]
MDVRFLEEASFALLGTHDGAGGFDLSRRGDPGGLLRVLGDRTLFLPDRPGNRIADSLRNVLATGQAGLLALVPDPVLLDRMMKRDAAKNLY